VSAADAVIVAVAFTWLGMVLAISFVEAPVKFRAPDVTLRIGLGIGRLVFRVLNAIEIVLAAVITVCLIVDTPPLGPRIPLVLAILVLVVQLAAVRPRLTRRSNAVLAGADGGPRSHAHLWYVGFELVKVAALLVAGIWLLASAV
jgi:hypothetical protein